MCGHSGFDHLVSLLWSPEFLSRCLQAIFKIIKYIFRLHLLFGLTVWFVTVGTINSYYSLLLHIVCALWTWNASMAHVYISTGQYNWWVGNVLFTIIFIVWWWSFWQHCQSVVGSLTSCIEMCSFWNLSHHANTSTHWFWYLCTNAECQICLPVSVTGNLCTLMPTSCAWSNIPTFHWCVKIIREIGK